MAESASSPGAPGIRCRKARGEGTVADSGRYETQGDRNRGSVVAAAISFVAASSGVSGPEADCAQTPRGDSATKQDDGAVTGESVVHERLPGHEGGPILPQTAHY